MDFIIHSVNDVLKSEFGKTFADDHVHVLDPFTGTGTFINRLLQSGLIPADRLTYKYKTKSMPMRLFYWRTTLPLSTLKPYITIR